MLLEQYIQAICLAANPLGSYGEGTVFEANFVVDNIVSFPYCHFTNLLSNTYKRRSGLIRSQTYNIGIDVMLIQPNFDDPTFDLRIGFNQAELIAHNIASLIEYSPEYQRVNDGNEITYNVQGFRDKTDTILYGCTLTMTVTLDLSIPSC